MQNSTDDMAVSAYHHTWVETIGEWCEVLTKLLEYHRPDTMRRRSCNTLWLRWRIPQSQSWYERDISSLFDDGTKGRQALLVPFHPRSNQFYATSRTEPKHDHPVTMLLPLVLTRSQAMCQSLSTWSWAGFRSTLPVAAGSASDSAPRSDTIHWISLIHWQDLVKSILRMTSTKLPNRKRNLVAFRMFVKDGVGRLQKISNWSWISVVPRMLSSLGLSTPYKSALSNALEIQLSKNIL